MTEKHRVISLHQLHSDGYFINLLDLNGKSISSTPLSTKCVLGNWRPSIFCNIFSTIRNQNWILNLLLKKIISIPLMD